MIDWLRSDVVGKLDLVNINTPSGDFGFIVGTDGVFTDINGKVWYGSTLFKVGSLETVIGGAVPSGSIQLAFFQNPDEPDLIQQIKDEKLEEVVGRKITFYDQPILSMAELQSPTLPPQQWLQRTMRSLVFTASGAQDRSITVTFEPWTEERDTARAIPLSVEGHSEILGQANPSLEFMPTTDFEEQKLFG